MWVGRELLDDRLGLKSGLLTEESQTELIEQLNHCLSQKIEQPNLASGWAGVGIAIMECKPLLTRQSHSTMLNNAISNILAKQLKDGSWKSPDLISAVSLKQVAGISGFF